MHQTLTAKLQIFPKPSDRQLLFDTTKAYSAACTYVSDYVHANHTPLNIFHSAHSVRTPWIGLSMKEQYTEQRN